MSPRTALTVSISDSALSPPPTSEQHSQENDFLERFLGGMLCCSHHTTAVGDEIDDHMLFASTPMTSNPRNRVVTPHHSAHRRSKLLLNNYCGDKDADDATASTALSSQFEEGKYDDTDDESLCNQYMWDEYGIFSRGNSQEDEAFVLHQVTP